MPEILPETDEEKYICAGYEQRQASRLLQRQLDKELQSKLTTTEPWNHER